ncbi:hypothetical protein Pmani_023157 [Petrolisthes manimaculis]|uniref:Uncharacterized protein n=1 Tax=Petrolisthes manimaculis TaxID=1843537 RepID=A0AAE1U3N9_9EUCA|nr:hypothetical protein Pmani_023157 [Petrolisthes manimaculis]
MNNGLPWWGIAVLGISCFIISFVFFVIFTCGLDRTKIFIAECRRKIDLPHGLSSYTQSTALPQEVKRPWYDIFTNHREKKTITNSTSKHKAFEEQEVSEPTLHSQEVLLIKPANERQGRNLSGDSGTSVADNNADSSGCSTGGDSDCSSGSDGLHPSSDSGTVQEDPGFPSGEVRYRPQNSAPPYVCHGLPKTCPQPGYVAVGSVPNLTVGMGCDGGVGSSLPQSTPSLGTEMEGAEVRMSGRRTSTGYISMPTSEADGCNMPLSDLGNLTLPHERREGHLPPYSRHFYPYKKAYDFNSPYIKAQSLPWLNLNAGYVAVAQAEAANREMPQTQGYVAVGEEGLPGMKRQSSLLSLPLGVDKTARASDEDRPLGAYCRVGTRGIPATSPPASSPSPGYVSVTPDLTAFTSPRVIPPNKTPYVTYAMAEALSSPTKQPEKSAYVSVGDMPSGRWAHPVHPTNVGEETRDVLSAPIEGTRARPHQPPTRPNTTDATGHHGREGANRFVPLGHSLSKQSSGYASGNVSQETLSFHDPVVMSPKKLLARSQEPHSVVYSPNHNSSMV